MADNNMHLLNFINCKRCGKPFSTVFAYTICPPCMTIENERFNRVRDYIYDNPGATEIEVVAECKVNLDELTRWIREERLILTDKSPMTFPCESCGTPIRCGHFCSECKKKLQEPSSSSSQMHPYGTSMHHFRKK